jgi:hypothetical protein
MSVPTGWGYEKMTKRSRKLAAKEGISEPQAFARLAEQDPTRRCPQPTEEKVRQRKCVRESASEKVRQRKCVRESASEKVRRFDRSAAVRIADSELTPNHAVLFDVEPDPHGRAIPDLLHVVRLTLA